MIEYCYVIIPGAEQGAFPNKQGRFCTLPSSFLHAVIFIHRNSSGASWSNPDAAIHGAAAPARGFGGQNEIHSA